MFDAQAFCKWAQTQSDWMIWSKQLKVAAKRADQMVELTSHIRYPIDRYAESAVCNLLQHYNGESCYNRAIVKRLTNTLLRSLGVR